MCPAVHLAAAHISWCDSRYSCQAWREPGPGPALGNAEALPLPAGRAKCQAPGVAGVSVAMAPSHHPAPHRLSHASRWGLNVWEA